MLYLLLTALSAAITIVGGSVALYEYIKQRQHKGITLGITLTTLVLTFVFFWASIPYIGSVSGKGVSITPTISNPPPASGTTPTQAQQISTATPAVLATYAIQQVNTSLPLQLPCRVASDRHWKLR